MKERLSYYWNMFRAGYHWNRMIAKQDSTGLTHSTLLWMHRSYERSSISYNQSIEVLVASAHYVTAKSLIRKRENNVCSIITE